jgi:hypothetical protein
MGDLGMGDLGMLARQHPAAAQRVDGAPLRAAAINQAPGFRGTPVRDHSDSAVTKASCASSSATVEVAHHPREAGDQPGPLDPEDRLDRRIAPPSRRASLRPASRSGGVRAWRQRFGDLLRSRSSCAASSGVSASPKSAIS